MIKSYSLKTKTFCTLHTWCKWQVLRGVSTTQFRLSFVYIFLLNKNILGFNFWSPEIECMINPFVSKDQKKRSQEQPYRELFILRLNQTEHMTVRTGPKAKFAGQHGLSIHLNQCLHYVFSVVENMYLWNAFILPTNFPMCLEPRLFRIDLLTSFFLLLYHHLRTSFFFRLKAKPFYTLRPWMATKTWSELST